MWYEAWYGNGKRFKSWFLGGSSLPCLDGIPHSDLEFQPLKIYCYSNRNGPLFHEFNASNVDLKSYNHSSGNLKAYKTRLLINSTADGMRLRTANSKHFLAYRYC